MPRQRRGLLAFDGKLLCPVAQLPMDSILGWYQGRRRFELDRVFELTTLHC